MKVQTGESLVWDAAPRDPPRGSHGKEGQGPPRRHQQPESRMQAGRGRRLVGCFSWCAQRSVLVLRKLQIRKALGNERVAGADYTAAWRGARDAACGDGLAEQVKYHWNRDRMASSFPPAARRELLLRWAVAVSGPVEVQVGGGAGSPGSRIV